MGVKVAGAAFAALASVATCGTSACSPAQRQTALATASTAALVLDWRQTQRITADCQESNPLLGSCGDRIPPGVYFPAVIALHLAAGVALPAGWSEAWFAAWAGFEGKVVHYNHRAGVPW